MPLLTVIAGPNGSGKSTFTQAVDFDGHDRLIDPDAVARALNPNNPRGAAMAAGREVLKRTSDCLAAGVSFAVETTLSGKGAVNLITTARCRGYKIHLVFVGLDSPERCIARVRDRTAKGGHDVPNADVRRRYERAVGYISTAIRLSHRAKVYDNSGDGHRLVLMANDGNIVWQANPLPAWLRL